MPAAQTFNAQPPKVFGAVPLTGWRSMEEAEAKATAELRAAAYPFSTLSSLAARSLTATPRGISGHVAHPSSLHSTFYFPLT